MKLFISYVHDDRPLVQPLVELLQGAGHTVLFDDMLVVSENWQEQLRRQIASADAYIYALTPTSMANEWCQWEMVTAVEHNQPIILVILQPTYLPSYLINRRRADFTRGFSDAGRVAEFLGSLRLYVPISRSETLPKPAFPNGLPSRVPPDTPASFKHRSPRIALGGRTSATARRGWIAPVIVVAAVLLLFAIAVFFLVPDWQTLF